MKISQTLKAAALSGAILGVQPGCLAETELCDLRGNNPNSIIMEDLRQVKEFCHYYRDAVITCVQITRQCPISDTSTTTCANLQSNEIFKSAEDSARLNGTFNIACVEGTGIAYNRE